MFFKMTEPRTESEWVRETAHEYGHVAIPPFGGFGPPLEPYANGLVGETLGMLWAATTAESFGVHPPTTSITPVAASPAATLSTEFAGHVAREAIPALRFWNQQGPYSPLRRDGTRQGLRYLQGLAVHLERVYGAQALGDALRLLAERDKPAADRVVPSTSLNAASLLDSLPGALRDPFAATGVLPVWLPGALEVASDNAPAPFIKREPMRLYARQRAACWLFIPPTAVGLHIEWGDARATPAGQTPVLRVEGAWKTSTPAATLPGSSKALRIDVSTLSGWQHFTFVPTADIMLTGAYFERERRDTVKK
jgi:hypothetical protein